MGCRFRLNNLACGTQENDSDIPRNGEVSEEAGSGCPGDELLGLGKSGWQYLGEKSFLEVPN